MSSLVYSHQFPNFLRTTNSQSLFLVACRSTSISTRYTGLLHAWAVSYEGTGVYHRLLKLLQHPLPPDELMLHLSALVLLCDMRASTERDDMQPPQRVCLADLDLLLEGDISIHKSQRILREMLWSFSRAILSAISPDSQTSYLRFLGPAQSAFSAVGQSSDMNMDRYFKGRLQDSSSHADQYAQVENDTRPVPAPVRGLLEHAERDEDEMSNDNTVSTHVSEIPLVNRPRVEHWDHAGETGSSCLRWGALLNVLGLGSCSGRKIKS